MNSKCIVESIRALSRGEVPQHNIIDILSYHKCDYLYQKACVLSGKKKADEDIIINMVRAKEYYQKKHVPFSEFNFPYAVLKGVVLSNTTYNNPFTRYSTDLDILVKRSDLVTLKHILIKNGFVQARVINNEIVPFTRSEILFQIVNSHQIAPFVKKTNNVLCPFINIDINTDIVWGECTLKTDMEFVLGKTQKTNILGVDLYKLTSEMEFVALCLHHYKNINSLYLLSQGSICMGLYCDIYYYIKNVKPCITLVEEICTKLNVGKYIYVCILDTFELFNDNICLPYIEKLEHFKDTTLINTYGLTDTEIKEWDVCLFDRIFDRSLSLKITKNLSKKEKLKIRYNHIFM